MLDLALLARAPFHLDADALAWVETAFAGLSLDDKLAQIMVMPTLDLSEGALDQLLGMRPGGVHRFAGRVAELRESAAYLQSLSPLPLLMTRDIEFSEVWGFVQG